MKHFSRLQLAFFVLLTVIAFLSIFIYPHRMLHTEYTSIKHSTEQFSKVSLFGHTMTTIHRHIPTSTNFVTTSKSILNRDVNQAEYKRTTTSNMNNDLTIHQGTQKGSALPRRDGGVTSKYPSYISTNIFGRLGNNIFQYASLLGIAALNNKIPVISTNVAFLKLFNISHTSNIETGSWRVISERRYAALDPKFLSLPAGNVTVSDYLQCWRYFQHIETYLRRELKFNTEYLVTGTQLFNKFTSRLSNRTIIAIHVRRTDMLYALQGYTVAPLSYIMKAVMYMRNRFHNAVFLIASDDINWCAENLRSPDMILMKGDGDPFTDFVALTRCENIIMTVGTFGWWAAWFINGHTVYFKDYPKENSLLSRAFDKHDYFLPHWVPIGQ